MKHLFLIIVFSILTFSFSRDWFSPTEISKIDDSVLLLYYYVDQKIIVLKDYKDVNKRFRYLSVFPCTGPMFNNNMLLIEGHLAITDSSKVIFYGQCEILDITIPFSYEALKINCIENDSIVDFLFNKQKHYLPPDREFVDSIVSIDKEGERIIRNTSIIHFRNYGLIRKSSIIDYNEFFMKKEKIRDSIEMEEIRKLYEE